MDFKQMRKELRDWPSESPKKRATTNPQPHKPSDDIPGLKIALTLVETRKKAISDKLSMLEMVQELDRPAAMLRLEIEFASKIGKPLKKTKEKTSCGDCTICG